MKTKMILGFITLVTALVGCGDSADARDVSLKQFGSNSLAYEIPIEKFDLNKELGEVSEQSYLIKRKPLIRSGCMAKSPWLKVGASDRSFSLVPRLKVRWWGVFGPDQGFEYDLFEVRLYVKDGDNQVEHKRFFIHTGMLEKTWIAQYPNGDEYVRADFHSRMNRNYERVDSERSFVLSSRDMPAGSKFRVAVCNVFESTEVQIDSFVAISDPAE